MEKTSNAICVMVYDRAWSTRLVVNSIERFPERVIENHDFYVVHAGETPVDVLNVFTDSPIDFKFVVQGGPTIVHAYTTVWRALERYDRAIKIENDAIFGKYIIDEIHTLLDQFDAVVTMHSRTTGAKDVVHESSESDWFVMGMTDDVWDIAEQYWQNVACKYDTSHSDCPTAIDYDFLTNQLPESGIPNISPKRSRVSNIGVNGLNSNDGHWESSKQGLFRRDMVVDECVDSFTLV